MKEEPNFAVEEDTEEIKKKWRELNQSEIDMCWKKFAERMEEEVLDKYKVEESKKRDFQRWRCSLGMEKGAQKQEIQNKKVVRGLVGKNFLFVQRIQLAVFAKQAR